MDRQSTTQHYHTGYLFSLGQSAPQKYFYNNTLIDGVGFDYHAKPISILKGRIIAVIFFLAYSLSGLIHPFLPAVFGLIFLIALPWMIVRTMIFNARNTSHRGLRFNFVGKVGKAVATFIGLPLLAPFTLGLIIPYASHQKNQYLMNNHRFGMSPFTMQRVVKQFYLVYLKLLAILLLIVALIGMISAVAIPAYQDYIKRKTVVSQLASPTVHTTLTQKASPSAFIPTVNAATETYPSEQEMQAEYEAQMQQAMSQEAEKGRNKIEEMEKAAKFLPFIVPILLIYILIIFGFLGYLQARLGNLVWNNTTLDQLSFKSSLRERELVWLYFTNALAIMLTDG